MMIKIVVFGILATVALGQMPFLSGGMGGIAGMLKNIPPGMIENAMKDMTPEKIKDIMSNMPPEMEQMISGMGISKEQIQDAVNHMPEDLDISKIVDQVKDGGAMSMDSMKDMLQGKLKEMGINENVDDLKNMLPDLKKEIGEHLKEQLGIDFENSNKDEVMAQLKELAIKQLKENGFEFDPENREETISAVKREMKMIYGVDPDMDDNEFKTLVLKNFLIDMKEEGYDVDPENPEESMKKLKQIATDKAKEFGFDLSEGVDLKEQIMSKLIENGVPLNDPAKLMPYMMQKAQEYLPLIQQFMGSQEPPMMARPPMMPRPRMMPRPVQQPVPLTLNLEINMDEGDHPTTVGMPMRGDVMSHMLDAEYGIRTGSISEDEVMELLQDVLHYRTMSKYLIAKNEILQNKIDILTMKDRPVMSRSPMMAALLHRCKHEM